MWQVTQEEVLRILAPAIGSPLLADDALREQVTVLVSAYNWRFSGALDALFDKVEQTLFNGIYQRTQGSMMSEDPQGRPLRITTEGIVELTDTLIAQIIERMPVRQETYELINEYALRKLSLPALRRLYVDFARFLPAMNREIIARVVTENFAPEAYRDWLV